MNVKIAQMSGERLEGAIAALVELDINGDGLDKLSQIAKANLEAREIMRKRAASGDELCICALGMAKDSGALPMLRKAAFDTTNPDSRLAALEALFSIEQGGAFKDLVKILDSGESNHDLTDFAWRSIIQLWCGNDRNAIEFIDSRLNSSNKEIRMTTIIEIVTNKENNPRDIAFLWEIIQEGNEKNAVWALNRLRFIADEDAISIIREASLSKNERISETAKKILQGSPQDSGNDIEKASIAEKRMAVQIGLQKNQTTGFAGNKAQHKPLGR